MGRLAELPLSRKDGQGEGWIEWLPGMLGGWTQVRDLHVMPKQTFREWFEQRGKDGAGRPRRRTRILMRPRSGRRARPGGGRAMSAEAAAVSRAEVLRRIRAALPDSAGADATEIRAEWETIPRNYVRTAMLAREAILELLEDRLRDYDATVVRAKAGAVGAKIARMLVARGKRRLVAPAGLAEAIGEPLPGWNSTLSIDEGLSSAEGTGWVSKVS